jgi:hypothetical protein
MTLARYDETAVRIDRPNRTAAPSKVAWPPRFRGRAAFTPRSRAKRGQRPTSERGADSRRSEFDYG